MFYTIKYVQFDSNFQVDEKLLNNLMQYAENYYDIEKNFTALELMLRIFLNLTAKSIKSN